MEWYTSRHTSMRCQKGFRFIGVGWILSTLFATTLTKLARAKLYRSDPSRGTIKQTAPVMRKVKPFRVKEEDRQETVTVPNYRRRLQMAGKGGGNTGDGSGGGSGGGGGGSSGASGGSGGGGGGGSSGGGGGSNGGSGGGSGGNSNGGGGNGGNGGNGNGNSGGGNGDNDGGNNGNGGNSGGNGEGNNGNGGNNGGNGGGNYNNGNGDNANAHADDNRVEANGGITITTNDFPYYIIAVAATVIVAATVTYTKIRQAENSNGLDAHLMEDDPRAIAPPPDGKQNDPHTWLAPTEFPDIDSSPQFTPEQHPGIMPMPFPLGRIHESSSEESEVAEEPKVWLAPIAIDSYTKLSEM